MEFQIVDHKVQPVLGLQTCYASLFNCTTAIRASDSMTASSICFMSCVVLFWVFFFSPFGIAITSLRKEGANLSAFNAFVRFVLVWFCWFPLPLGVWEGLRFVIVAFPGLFMLRHA